MLRELKASRMGHWLEKKEDFFILSQEVKEVWHCCAPVLHKGGPREEN